MPIEWSTATVLIILVLLALFSLGLPIAFTMGLVGFAGLYFLASPQVALQTVGVQVYSVPLNFILLAVPLFILMAQLIIVTGLGTDLYTAMEKFLSGTPAGLALATLGAGTVFAAVTGSSVAACATIGPVALKEMSERGYRKSLAAGCIAGAGGLAVIIPPSILFILYGFVAEISVAKLFIAGIIPGLLMAGFMALYTLLRVWQDPSIAPLSPGLPVKQRLFPLIRVWPMIVLIIMVLGSMYGGVTTPTESAAVGVLGSLILAIIFRRLNIRNIRVALLATARTTGFLLFIVVGALTFGFLMSYLRIPIRLTDAVTTAEMSPWTVLIMVNIVFLFLGMLMDAASLVLIVVPLLLPTLLLGGFDPIWLGVVLCVNIEMGLLTPPVGLNLYVLQGVGKPYGINFADVVRGSLPYVGAQAVAWLLVIIFPALALWLPSRMG